MKALHTKASPRLKPDARQEAALLEQEGRAKYVVWMGRGLGLLVAIAGAAVIITTQAHAPIHYVIDVALFAGLLSVAIAVAHYTRSFHVSLLRRYQAQLILQTMELKEMASKDPLTELYNRRFFYDSLEKELEKARHSKQPLAILLLDVDGLKAINDDYGHLVGDAVLANLAKVMVRFIRCKDLVARLGGDEFGIIMPETDKRGAFALARRLWQALQEAPIYQADGLSISVNVSIGVSGYPWGGEDVDEMMHWADADMYASKLSSKLPAGSLGAADSEKSVDSIPDDFE